MGRLREYGSFVIEPSFSETQSKLGHQSTAIGKSHLRTFDSNFRWINNDILKNYQFSLWIKHPNFLTPISSVYPKRAPGYYLSLTSKEKCSAYWFI